MNDQQIELVSSAMELIAIVSVAIASLVIWSNLRARRASRPEETSTSRSKPDGRTETRHHE